MVNQIVLVLLFSGLSVSAAYMPLKTTNGSVTVPNTKAITFTNFALSNTNGSITLTAPTDATTLDGLDSTAFLKNGNNLSDLDSASTARTNLGVAIGTNVQAYSSNLDTLAGNDGSDLTGFTDSQIPDTITLTNITQITNRSHTSLSDIGTNTHAQIDSHIANGSIHTSGTVTSVAVSGDNGLAIISGSPITTSGTIALTLNQGQVLIPSNIGSTVQAYSANLDNWAVNNGSEVQALTTAGFTIKASGGSDNLVLGASGSPTATAYGGWIFDGATADRIASFSGTKVLTALDTSTYPSLTELSYVKGVTSAIQTQFSNKQPLDSDLTSIAALSFASNGDLITTSGGSIIRLAKGSDNQVLTMNGNLLGWETPAGGGSSEWTDAGTYLYPNDSDEISVGTSTHNGALHVARSSNGYMAWYHNTKQLSDLLFNYRGVNSVSEIFDVMHTIDKNGTALMSYGYDGGKNSFIVSDNGNFANGRFLVGMDGNVGINSNSTIAQLTMNGTSVIAMKPVTAPSYDSGWGKLYIKSSTGNLTFLKDEMMSGTEYDLVKGSTAVQGPGSSTDTAVALWDGTSGALIKDSVVLVGSMGDVTGVASLAISGGMSDALTVSTNALKVDSGGNVGIGTATPSQSLDIARDAYFTSADIYMSNNKFIKWSDSSSMSTNNIIGVNSSDDIVISSFADMMSEYQPIIFKSKDSGAETMRLDHNGDVLIGTSTSKASNLVLSQAAATDGSDPTTIYVNSTTASSSWTAGAKVARIAFGSEDGSGAGAGIRSEIAMKAAGTSGAAYGLHFSVDTGSGVTEVFRFDKDTRFQIGSSSDTGTAKFNVFTTATSQAVLYGKMYSNATADTINTVNANGTELFVVDINAVVEAGDGTTTKPGFTFNDDQNNGLYRATTDAIGLVTAGSERIRIDSGGNVGIGDTTPSALLDVGGNAQIQGSAFFDSIVANTTSATTTINWSAGNKQKLTLTSNTTVLFSDPAGPTSLALVIKVANGGNHIVTWNGNILFPTNGTDLTVSTTNGFTDVVSCLYTGTAGEYLCTGASDFE